MVHIKIFHTFSPYIFNSLNMLSSVLVDLHLRLYAIENLATRSYLENNNCNIIKQALLSGPIKPVQRLSFSFIFRSNWAWFSYWKNALI